MSEVVRVTVSEKLVSRCPEASSATTVTGVGTPTEADFGAITTSLAKVGAGFTVVEALPAEDRRRPYQITAAGRDQLRERLSEAARIAEVGLRRISEAWL